MIKEEKFLTSREIFFKLLEYAKSNLESKCMDIQVNYYYDDDYFFLYKNNTVLRIKQIGDSLELRKKRQVWDNGSIQEISEVITNELTLPRIIDNRFLLKGSLIINRWSFTASEKIELILDENLYLGTNDFEVIIKSAETENKQFLNIINEFGLKNDYFINGKAFIFFKKLHELKPRNLTKE